MVSTDHRGLISRLKTTRCGGSNTRIRAHRHSLPVNAAMVAVVADSRLEHSLGDRGLEQVVLAGLEVTEALSGIR